MLDYLEIGTSDFDTCVQLAQQKFPKARGMSVEPVQYYLDRLPRLDHWAYVHAAVSDTSGETTIHYVHPEKFRAIGMVDWARGCNRIGQDHPTVVKILESRGLNPDAIMDRVTVPVLDVKELFRRYNVDHVGIMKVDTEGHDPTILRSYAELCTERPECKALELQFESNTLVTREDLTDVLRRLFDLGYLLVRSDHDTVLRLPVKSVTWEVSGWYLCGYPPHYDPSSLPHENTLEGALAYARLVGASGVTFQNGLYTARMGSTFRMDSDPRIRSYSTSFIVDS